MCTRACSAFGYWARNEAVARDQAQSAEQPPALVAGTTRVLRVSSSGVGQMKGLVGNVPRASRRGRTLIAHVSQKGSDVSGMFIHALGV